MPTLLNKHRLIIVLLGCCPLYFAASDCQAETLEQAWDAAIANNHQIKSAEADTRASEQ